MALLSLLQRIVLIYALMWGVTATAMANTPLGVWINPKNTVAVRIFQCEDRFCGRIIWLKKPLDKSGRPKRDRHNPDKNKRDRPLCGLKILRGFKSAGHNEWGSGTIYNPSDGATYRSVMRLKPNGTLRIRGYVGLPLLGKSITWQHPDIPKPACDLKREALRGGKNPSS